MTTAQLKKILRLNRREKIELVQTLWDDIAKEQEKLAVPKEHIKLLERRIKRIEKGSAKFKSWESVRKKFLRAVEI